MSFWRTEEPVIEVLDPETKVVRQGGMWDSQRRWWQLPLEVFVRMFVGGYGSGKSFVGLKRITSLSLHNSGIPHLMVGPTYPMAQTNLVEPLEELLDGKASLVKDMRWEHNQSKKTFKIYVGNRIGVIRWASGDDEKKLKGGNVAAALVDEPFIMDKSVWKQILARVRHPDARRREINLCGTPEQLNWGWELATGRLAKRLRIGIVHAPTTDNKVLPDSYFENLLAAFSEKEAQAYVQGQFVALASGRVLHAFGDHNVRDVRTPENATLFAGMDFGINPMAMMIGWKKNERVHFFAEHELPNSDVQEACTLLKRLYPGLTLVYADASGRQGRAEAPGGKSAFAILADNGFHVDAPGGNPLRSDRWAASNAAYKSSAGFVKCTVSPGCENFVRYAATYSHENMRKQKELSHLIDAGTYPLVFMWPIHHTRAEIKTVSWG